MHFFIEFGSKAMRRRGVGTEQLPPADILRRSNPAGPLLQMHVGNQPTAEIGEGRSQCVERIGDIKLLVTQCRVLITRQTQTTNFRHLAESASGAKSTKVAIESAARKFEAGIGCADDRQLVEQFELAWGELERSSPCGR